MKSPLFPFTIIQLFNFFLSLNSLIAKNSVKSEVQHNVSNSDLNLLKDLDLNNL